MASPNLHSKSSPNSSPKMTSARRGTYFGSFSPGKSPLSGPSQSLSTSASLSKKKRQKPKPSALQQILDDDANDDNDDCEAGSIVSLPPMQELSLNPPLPSSPQSPSQHSQSSYISHTNSNTNSNTNTNTNTNTTSTSLKQQAFSLQSKLVQLSLDIEDSSSTINLLNSKLKKAAISADSQQKDVGERYRHDFKVQSVELSKELQAKLAICDDYTNKKKSLATVLNDLQEQLQIEEAKTSKKIAAIQKASTDSINVACASWGEGEAIRRAKWLDRKTKEIREITVKGLEPEVQRIIDKHKNDCKEVDNEFERKKQAYLQTFFVEMDMKKSQLEENQLKKYNASLAKTRAAGNDRFGEVHEEQSVALNKLRKR